MLVSGPLILSSEAVRCYKTPAFWIKMALLAIADGFSFHHSPESHAGGAAGAASRARMVAGLSLALWIGVALAGKGIAIFQPA